uniref:3-deoxy-7-phosphoheptulonate synthase n=1 Tax=Guillardia theta TaxID=55529 RepID=A0A7S4NPH0_GUITH|mmetsp:Transcript_28623/g.92333  ORF Transcript_28623/g.92333 Transcript_28623/m.92333 type:complete len:394 (+) Transcript_28623:38-1219(+)
MSSKETAWAMAAGMGIAALIGGGSYMLGMQAAKAPHPREKEKEDEHTNEPFRVPRPSIESHESAPALISDDVVNVKISKIKPVISPTILVEELSSDLAYSTVKTARKCIGDILSGNDDRLLVVVGPCSIHDPSSALDYANRLVKLAEKLSNDLLVVMRVYFEKPRTTVGWKGLINDPDLDGSHNINKGIRLARRILLDINKLGMPCGCEFLDTISPQYLADLVSWGAIGARTTESQVHRELASGLSMPVGFKNGTSGDVQIASDAIKASLFPHCFLSVTSQGTVAIVTTKGNDDCHLILRGGGSGPNYDKKSVADAVSILEKSKLEPRNRKVVVDCSHGNSRKQHKNQPLVAKDIAEQISEGGRSIFGVMIESNIEEGNQPEPSKNGGMVKFF